jgi:hypothetical protein
VILDRPHQCRTGDQSPRLTAFLLRGFIVDYQVSVSLSPTPWERRMDNSKLTDGQLTVLVAQKVVARCIELAGAADAGSVVLSAAVFGTIVRMEFEAEMQRRFGPGGAGGVVFSDDVTDIMIATIWTNLGKGMPTTIDPASIARKRAAVGLRSPFPIIPMEGISFDYQSWIAPRCEHLAPEFTALSARMGAPVQMFPALTLATTTLFKLAKSPSQADLATLALDVMLGVARIPVGRKLQEVPNAPPPVTRSGPVAAKSQSSQTGWRQVFGRR